MYTFSFLDTYKISHDKKDTKFVIDYKVLVRLYGPIIGCNAMSLYLVLESEVSLNKDCNEHFTIARLHKLLQCDDKQFNMAIETLKEYGLITYKANQRKANDYLFVLKSTQTATEFLNDEKLNKALQVIVDENYYKQVCKYFLSIPIIEDEYVDIEDIKIVKDLTEDEFYGQFYEKYPVIASYEDVITSSDKKEINRLKKLFNLSYDDVENAILNSFDYIDNKMKLNVLKLNDFISQKYQEKVSKENNNSDELIAKTFDRERSIAYYKKLSGRTTLLPRETAMINELLDQYKITEGVLNVVINYYFKYGQRTLGVSKNYFVKTIEEMLLNGVKTTLDAMNYFRNRNKRIKKYYENQKNNNEISLNSKENKPNEDDTIDQATIDEFKKLMDG